MEVLFAGFLIVAALVILSQAYKTFQQSQLPVEEVSAKITGKRPYVSGGGDYRSTTTYFVTLELSGGVRREYSVSGRLFALLAERDHGLAYIQGQVLTDFDREDGSEYAS